MHDKSPFGAEEPSRNYCFAGELPSKNRKNESNRKRTGLRIYARRAMYSKVRWYGNTPHPKEAAITVEPYFDGNGPVSCRFCEPDFRFACETIFTGSTGWLAPLESTTTGVDSCTL